MPISPPITFIVATPTLPKGTMIIPSPTSAEAIKLNPKYVDAYNGRGNAHLNKHEYDEAVADYSEAVKLNPNFAICVRLSR